MSEKFLDKVVDAIFFRANTIEWEKRGKVEKLKGFISCLYDDEKMAKLISKKFVASSISRSDVLEYVKTSKHFAELKDNFEQNIVWQKLTQSMVGISGLLVDASEAENTNKRVDYVELFRGGISGSLKALGLSEDSIEKGLETSAEVWRPLAIEIAFTNEYGKYGLFSEDRTISFDSYVGQIEEEYNKYAEFMYYARHRASVDKYGEKTPAMYMDMDEAALCLHKIKQMIERKTEFASLNYDAAADGTVSYVNTPDGE